MNGNAVKTAAIAVSAVGALALTVVITLIVVRLNDDGEAPPAATVTQEAPAATPAATTIR